MLESLNISDPILTDTELFLLLLLLFLLLIDTLIPRLKQKLRNIKMDVT